jgi:hypothetical protein
MTMKKTLFVTTLAALAIIAPAQVQRVSIKSKGDDIRQVIATIFEQTNQQYVLETGVRQSLYMNLENVALDKAIEIVGNVAELSFTKKEGIWYVNTRRGSKTSKPPVVTTPKNEVTGAQKFVPNPNGDPKKGTPITKDPIKIEPATKPPKEKGTGEKTTSEKTSGEKPSATKKIDLTARLTTKLQKTDIREVFAEFGRQTEVKIEVADSVPNYKIDAFMFNTSLKFALDRVCAAAGLKYEFAPGKTVRISKA